MKFLENGKLAELTAMLTDATIGTGDRVINGRIEAFTMKRAGTDKKYAHYLGEKYQQELDLAETELAELRKTFGRSESAGCKTDSKKQIQSVSRKGKRRSRSEESVSSTLKLKPCIRTRSDSFDLSKSPNYSYSNSALGDFSNSCTRRLMTDLILTLNTSFPDYDFSNVKPSHFVRIPTSTVAMNRTNQKLSELAATTAVGSNFLQKLWHAIDDAISLTDSDVYAYVPPNKDDDDDPLSFLTLTLDGPDLTNTMPLWSFNFFFVNKSLKRILLFACVQTMRNEIISSSVDEEDTTGASAYHEYDVSFRSPNLDIDNSGFGGYLEEEDDEPQDLDLDADCMGHSVSVPPPPPTTVA